VTFRRERLVLLTLAELLEESSFHSLGSGCGTGSLEGLMKGSIDNSSIRKGLNK